MVNVLGLDIGGANTKSAILSVQDGTVIKYESTLEHFPFWKHDSTDFCRLLSKLQSHCDFLNLDLVGVTLTAELSDAFRTKREGVSSILSCVCQVFGGTDVLVLDVEAELRSIDAARNEPLKVASANWVATGWMIAQYVNDCIIVDVGSTSTSIIPVLGGRVVAAGKTDLEKLINGELVYTGTLRTNIAAITKEVPVNGQMARVSSELFAQSGDVHIILGYIKEKDYTSETPDGKEKNRKASLSRLARIVCADSEMLTENEITEICTYVYHKQIDQIAEGIAQVAGHFRQKSITDLPVVVTGSGKDFLAKKAAEEAGTKTIRDLSCFLPPEASLASPALGVALMAATKIEGKRPTWRQ